MGPAQPPGSSVQRGHLTLAHGNPPPTHMLFQERATHPLLASPTTLPALLRKTSLVPPGITPHDMALQSVTFQDNTRSSLWILLNHSRSSLPLLPLPLPPLQLAITAWTASPVASGPSLTRLTKRPTQVFSWLKMTNRAITLIRELGHRRRT